MVIWLDLPVSGTQTNIGDPTEMFLSQCTAVSPSWYSIKPTQHGVNHLVRVGSSFLVCIYQSIVTDVWKAVTVSFYVLVHFQALEICSLRNVLHHSWEMCYFLPYYYFAAEWGIPLPQLSMMRDHNVPALILPLPHYACMFPVVLHCLKQVATSSCLGNSVNAV